jgi:hypothetical protein
MLAHDIKRKKGKFILIGSNEKKKSQYKVKIQSTPEKKIFFRKSLDVHLFLPFFFLLLTTPKVTEQKLQSDFILNQQQKKKEEKPNVSRQKNTYTLEYLIVHCLKDISLLMIVKRQDNRIVNIVDLVNR